MLAMVNRVIVIDGGKIVADGPRDRIMEALASGRVREGGMKLDDRIKRSSTASGLAARLFGAARAGGRSPACAASRSRPTR